jgi:hypothetical protein
LKTDHPNGPFNQSLLVDGQIIMFPKPCNHLFMFAGNLIVNYPGIQPVRCCKVLE